jgi:hypothetical protein
VFPAAMSATTFQLAAEYVVSTWEIYALVGFHTSCNTFTVGLFGDTVLKEYGPHDPFCDVLVHAPAVGRGVELELGEGDEEDGEDVVLGRGEGEPLPVCAGCS